MSDPETHSLTHLLLAWNEGDQSALERLTPLVHAELYRLAKHYMSRERPGHPLQATALVNEAFVKLIDWKQARWQNRAHFFGVSATLMRRILVDFARSRPRVEGKDIQQVSLDHALCISSGEDADLLALDEALLDLERMDPRKGRIVELRFFGGLTVEETAEVLNISTVTVMREWNKAKAWLYRELSRKQEGHVD